MPSSVATEGEFNALSLRVTLAEEGIKKLDERLKKLENPPAPIPPTPTTGLTDDFSQAWKLTTEGTKTPNGLWSLKYLSGGTVESINGMCHMRPRVSTSPSQTSAPQLNSVQSFKNFQLDLDMRTNQQLRTGSQVNPWETAWIIFRYTDELPKSNHHYYFTLKTNGYEFGKKDNKPTDTTLEKQIFLKTGATPTAKLGTFQHITIKAVGYRFTISVNGTTIIDYTDPTINDPAKMQQGLVCLYGEDADVNIDNVKLVVLP